MRLSCFAVLELWSAAAWGQAKPTIGAHPAHDF